MPKKPVIAVLIPCFNEEIAIKSVIQDFQSSIPDADIYVFDNNSSDQTVQVAKSSGADVRNVAMQGKGNVVRRMFADIEADAYVLVDGDGTYSAESAPQMINLMFEQNYDMVVARRRTKDENAFRNGHVLGNWVLTEFVARLFGRSFEDILSGYRVFSRRYVKSFPAIASGFEIETELTVHALELRMPIMECDSEYISRCEGSFSKLNTYRDGFRILTTIFNLYRLERPLLFFGVIGLSFIVGAVSLAIPVLETYLVTGYVPRLPTAVLVTGLCIVGFLSFLCGLVLDTVTRGRHEFKRLIYLQIPAPK